MIRSTFAGFSTALSALQANQKRLDITGQNLANMNTKGYSRQQLETSSLNYSGPVSNYMNGSGVMVGFGVHMNKVSQIRDPFLDAQYRAQMGKAGYTDSMQTALDYLANAFDESNMPGIQEALTNIKQTLSSMQQAEHVNDAVLESELRSRMQALTNLLNGTAQQILEGQKAEYERLDGTGTSENGAVQEVNDILRRLGDLNVQIKQNQIMGQESLELQDQRNMLLDELSSFLPIEVSYYKDSTHSGTYQVQVGTNPDGTPIMQTRDRMYDYDAKGNVIGKRQWPDDMKVELVYKHTDPVTGAVTNKRMTLVDGSNRNAAGKNYAELGASGSTNPSNAKITVNAPDGTTEDFNAGDSAFAKGSIQASLDMLGKDGTTPGKNDVRGYQYYMNSLDTLAKHFVDTFNGLNNQHNADPTDGSNNLLKGSTALDIGLDQDWVNGTVHISTGGTDATDTILEMFRQMSASQAGLGNKTFADYINNVSTILANDSSANTNALTTDVTVLNGIQNSRDSVSGVSLDEEASNMMAYVSAYNAASRLMTALDEALNTLISGTGLVGR